MTHSADNQLSSLMAATLTTPLKSLSVMVLAGRLQSVTTSYVSQNNQNSGTTSGTNTALIRELPLELMDLTPQIPLIVPQLFKVWYEGKLFLFLQDNYTFYA